MLILFSMKANFIIIIDCCKKLLKIWLGNFDEIWLEIKLSIEI